MYICTIGTRGRSPAVTLARFVLHKPATRFLLTDVFLLEVAMKAIRIHHDLMGMLRQIGVIPDQAQKAA